MASDKKIAANKTNAKKSTGPNDTSVTRFNATSHGILSGEVVITKGEGREDLAQYDEIRNRMKTEMAPDGVTEELLVDYLTALTWRMRRVLRYETAAIRMEADAATENWERQEEQKRSSSEGLLISVTSGTKRWQSTKELEESLRSLRSQLTALKSQEPLEADPEMWRRVFFIAAEQYEVATAEISGLEKIWAKDQRESGFLEPSGWEDHVEATPQEVQLVLEAACRELNVSQDEIWKEIEELVQAEYDEADHNLSQRLLELDRIRMLASLPDNASQTKVERYEAHIWRQFNKTLHELQRLQAARLTGRPILPVAVDVSIESG